MAKRILLVDDEEGIRKVLAISLRDKGYEVFTAEGGDRALEIFDRHEPSIVLTDIKMPGMDGIELLQKIKSSNPETEVIMITGHGDMELAIQSLKFDATDFVTKPIRDEVLEIALKRAFERINMRKQLKAYTENLETLVKEKTEQLLAAERLAAIGQTVSGLAHAIKNIAGALTGGSFVLEKGIDLGDEKYLHEGWEMLRSNVSRIKGLALDLLNLSREREPNYQLCDPNEPLRRVWQLMHETARNKEISLDLETDDQLPKVWIDPDGIHRCIMNLLTNSMDACLDMDCTQPHGRVVLRSLRENGWAVQYEAMDNGCGMDDETKGSVFNKFFSTKGSKGTGLGLMITRKIVQEHGGEITFTSEKGKGTTFIIRLPIKNLSGDLAQ
ncbi:MAG: response regulator [Desulfatiglandaceae bacterium]|jgi:signal transduction histidine kinase